MISLNPEERPTVSIEEAGIVLGISRWGAYQAAKTGELRTVRFGRRVRVPTAALRRMLALDDSADADGITGR